MRNFLTKIRRISFKGNKDKENDRFRRLKGLSRQNDEGHPGAPGLATRVFDGLQSLVGKPPVAPEIDSGPRSGRGQALLRNDGRRRYDWRGENDE